MPSRKILTPAQPVRRSERLRLRKEAAAAAEAAEEARLAELKQQEPESLGELPRRSRRSTGRKRRASSGVATGGGVTRRRVRRRRTVPASTSTESTTGPNPSINTSTNSTTNTSTPIAPESGMALFGRFMDSIFRAARESNGGMFSEGPIPIPIPIPNRDEGPTQGPLGWMTTREVQVGDGTVEELDIIISMLSSDSDMEAT